MLILDIEEYGAPYRTDAIRFWLCFRLRQFLTSALNSCGINERQYAMAKSGDGWLVAVDAAVGKPPILGPVMDQFAAGLQKQNHEVSMKEQLRVRLVLHAGDLLIDEQHGDLEGNVLVLAARLLDADKLRVLLKQASGPLLVCVSDAIYQQVIAQRHEGLDPADYEPVWLESKDAIPRLGWVRAPGESGLAARVGLLASNTLSR